MNDFNHFLITRFNVKSRMTFDEVNPDPEKTINNESWLTSRFELFDKFCYPSVTAQSNQNFKWLVFFDFHTPKHFKKRIEQYSKLRSFVPIYVNNLSLEVVRNCVKKNLTNNPRYLITTRIDNDDAICRNYIQMIQDNFQEQDFQLINFHYGYIWHEPSGRIYLRGSGSNPFLSLIESIEGLKTVWFEPHNRYHKLYWSTGLLKNISTKPAWLQIVHGNNLYNKINGIRQPRKNLGNDFSINVKNIIAEENSVLIWLERKVNYFTSIPWVRKLRTRLALKSRLQSLIQRVTQS